jgi:hypothetical protein
MADGTAKPVIFISYSHKDRAWLDYVRPFFERLAAHRGSRKAAAGRARRPERADG